MSIKSKRLILHKFTEDHYDLYCQWYQNEEVMQYITGKALNDEETLNRFNIVLENNRIDEYFGLFAAFTSAMEYLGVGRLSVTEDQSLEIGFGLFPKFWRQGYGTEMMNVLLEHAKSQGKHKQLIAIADPANKPSIKILTSAGMHRVRQWVAEDGLNAVQYNMEI